MTNTSCTPKRSSQRRISRRKFLRYAGLAGLALLGGGVAAPLFESRSKQADADESHQVYFPLIAKLPPIPPLSQELVQEAYQFYALGDPVSPDSLRFQFKHNLNNPDQPPIIFARDPESNKVILATRFNPETEEQEWHVAKIRDLADAMGIEVGAQLSYPHIPYAVRQEIDRQATDSYNAAIILWSAWVFTEPEPGVFTFDKANAAIDLAENNNMTIRGDHLVYGFSNFQ